MTRGLWSYLHIRTASQQERSDRPTVTKGCASDFTTRTAALRERSGMQKVTRGLRPPAHVMFSRNTACAPRKIDQKMSKTTFCAGFCLSVSRSTNHRACHGKWARGIRSASLVTRNQFPSSPNIAPATHNDFQNRLSS